MNEAVEDKIGVSQPSKSLFFHAEALQKIDDYLAYYRCQPEATPENLSKLILFREYSAKKEKALSNKLLFFLKKINN